MSAITQRLKDLHTLVVAAPAQCKAWPERNGHVQTATFSAAFMRATLQQVEVDLRYLLQDLAGEKMEVPPAGWELGDHAVECKACGTFFPMVRDAGNCPKCGELVEKDAMVGADTAPHEDTSISGEAVG